MTNKYESPLSARYASEYMLRLFSADMRIQTWRKLWVSLAKAEMELGLPISAAQVEALEKGFWVVDRNRKLPPRPSKEFERWYRNGGEVTHNYLKHIRKEWRKEVFDYLHALPLNIDIELHGKSIN